MIGYDPAWTGGDRHAMAWRRGRCVLKVETRQRLDTVQSAGWVRHVIDTERPAKVFIDVGGVLTSSLALAWISPAITPDGGSSRCR